jgi:hypothetical protein
MGRWALSFVQEKQGGFLQQIVPLPQQKIILPVAALVQFLKNISS